MRRSWRVMMRAHHHPVHIRHRSQPVGSAFSTVTSPDDLHGSACVTDIAMAMICSIAKSISSPVDLSSVATVHAAHVAEGRLPRSAPVTTLDSPSLLRRWDGRLFAVVRFCLVYFMSISKCPRQIGCWFAFDDHSPSQSRAGTDFRHSASILSALQVLALFSIAHQPAHSCSVMALLPGLSTPPHPGPLPAFFFWRRSPQPCFRPWQVLAVGTSLCCSDFCRHGCIVDQLFTSAYLIVCMSF